MSTPTLTLVAISDLHYTGLTRQPAQNTRMRGELAKTLLRKVFLRLRHMGIKPDATIVLGDLVENGDGATAERDLAAIHEELTRSAIPYFVCQGNHDVTPTFSTLFQSQSGLQKIGDYGILLFSDQYDHSHVCERTQADLDLPLRAAQENPGLPLIAIQHPPIYPAIQSHYPYRPKNVAKIMESYHKSGVLLSLSGHYHKGQKPRLNGDVLYHTVPALCEAPFSFSVIRMQGTQVEIEELALELQLPNLIDVHCHTENAYCADDVETEQNIALAKALGVTTLCITEHAFQLYFEKKYAMSFAWQNDPAAVQKIWATPERYRMAAYTAFAEKLRSPFVKIGLEVDLYDNGKLLLAPEDMEMEWDILVGAIHCIHDYVHNTTTQKEAEKLFIRDVIALTSHPIKVLAHPFRFFKRHKLQLPTHLYGEVADILCDSGVALEINYHTHTPDPKFIEICAKKGVTCALASDSHDLAEVGEFYPHMQVLKQAGITPKMYPEALFSF